MNPYSTFALLALSVSVALSLLSARAAPPLGLSDILCVGPTCGDHIKCADDSDCPPQFKCVSQGAAQRQGGFVGGSSRSSSGGGGLFGGLLGRGNILGGGLQNLELPGNLFRTSGGVFGIGPSLLRGSIDGIWSSQVRGIDRPMISGSLKVCAPVPTPYSSFSGGIKLPQSMPKIPEEQLGYIMRYGNEMSAPIQTHSSASGLPHPKSEEAAYNNPPSYPSYGLEAPQASPYMYDRYASSPEYYPHRFTEPPAPTLPPSSWESTYAPQSFPIAGGDSSSHLYPPLLANNQHLGTYQNYPPPPSMQSMEFHTMEYPLHNTAGGYDPTNPPTLASDLYPTLQSYLNNLRPESSASSLSYNPLSPPPPQTPSFLNSPAEQKPSTPMLHTSGRYITYEEAVDAVSGRSFISENHLYDKNEAAIEGQSAGGGLFMKQRAAAEEEEEEGRRRRAKHEREEEEEEGRRRRAKHEREEEEEEGEEGRRRSQPPRQNIREEKRALSSSIDDEEAMLAVNSGSCHSLNEQEEMGIEGQSAYALNLVNTLWSSSIACKNPVLTTTVGNSETLNLTNTSTTPGLYATQLFSVTYPENLTPMVYVKDVKTGANISDTLTLVCTEEGRFPLLFKILVAFGFDVNIPVQLCMAEGICNAPPVTVVVRDSQTMLHTASNDPKDFEIRFDNHNLPSESHHERHRLQLVDDATLRWSGTNPHQSDAPHSIECSPKTYYADANSEVAFDVSLLFQNLPPDGYVAFYHMEGGEANTHAPEGVETGLKMSEQEGRKRIGTFKCSLQRNENPLEFMAISRHMSGSLITRVCQASVVCQ